LGTPHRGTNASTYGKWLAHISHAMGQKSDTTLLKMLKYDSQELFDISEDFWSEYKDLDMVCYFETKKSTYLGIDCKVNYQYVNFFIMLNETRLLKINHLYYMEKEKYFWKQLIQG
jgi:hypothetical protein